MAKKRYYSSTHGRNRSDGQEGRMYKKMEEYAGSDSRNRMEMEDSHMIREDRNAVANLPQNVIMRPWNMVPHADYRINDTIAGIDVQMHDDSEMRKENRFKTGKFPEKY